MRNRSGFRTRLVCVTTIGAALLGVRSSWGALWERDRVAPDSTGKATGRGHRERIVELTCRFTVSDVPAGAETVYAWVPIPPTSRWQRLEGLFIDDVTVERQVSSTIRSRVTHSLPRSILTEPEYGNRFLRLDLSGTGPIGDHGLTVSVTFRVSRLSYRALNGSGAQTADSPASLRRFLEPDRLVPIDGKIAEEARRVTAGAEGPLARARLLYDHIVDSVRYDKTGKGWGLGDALRACDVRTGNCTDFHSLFIGEARALGIPARFVMGVTVPEGEAEGTIPGYHCWAEFLAEGRGWIPVDASEASKDPKRRDELFGGLDANRVQFATGRDIRIPRASSGPMNYVIHPYVEVDGRPHAAVTTRFSFREAAEPRWHESLSDALTEAEARQTLVLVDAYADWCELCRRLDEGTLSDPRVRDKLRDFTILKIDTDEQRQLAVRFRVRELPTTLVLNESGAVVARRSGYMAPAAYVSFLASVVKAGTRDAKRAHAGKPFTHNDRTVW